MVNSSDIPQSIPSSRQYESISLSLEPTPSTTSTPSDRAPCNAVAHREQPQQQHSQLHNDNQPAYRDVYSHPAVVAYAAAHPRRTIPKFGPYLLLRTLSDDEFGKVKLGLHGQWGMQVAVKLSRRGDTNVSMSKIEREIEILRPLKHPNIVRLYDVIETDKYIGIVLEYASGGKLFDHVLAHCYLKEKDAARLFSQLISGVWYMHQKKIVHRNLKLESILLDRHLNVVITDFCFANRFDHRSDDLMQTSCGSPYYAAPELVISEELYVGSAVDIWACGVILYAMLAGYLPFDDDPANPDGDNINLMYNYIVNIPLSFPEYISPQARDLISIMLVPDPARRANLGAVMGHAWVAPFADVLGRDVEELERVAKVQHQTKRMTCRKQMKQTAAAVTSAKASNSNTSNHNASSDNNKLKGEEVKPLNARSEAEVFDDNAGTDNKGEEVEVENNSRANSGARIDVHLKSDFLNAKDEDYCLKQVKGFDEKLKPELREDSEEWRESQNSGWLGLEPVEVTQKKSDSKCYVM